MGVTVAVVQMTCAPADVEANVAAHVTEVDRAGADVVVFPELSLTGYELAAIAGGLAVERDDERLAPLVEACRRTGTIAIAGAPADGLLAALVIDGSGVRDVYGKQHLHGDERDVFATGDRIVLVEAGGRRLALGVCFDSAHDEHAGGCRAAGAGAYLVGALFVDGEEAELERRMAARARDHGLWVALANHAGPTPLGTACGGSGVWGPDGEPVARLGRDAGLATARLPAG